MSKSKISLLFFLVLLLLLLALFPVILKQVLNGPINKKIACCSLYVEDVEINYLPVQIILNGVKFLEDPQNNPEIRTTIKQGIISLRGLELSEFLLALDLEIYSPEIFYFDDGEEEKQTKKKKEEDSGPTYLPLKILNANIKDGKIHFAHKAVKGKQAIDFHNIEVKLTNWSFRKNDSLTSTFFISSTLEEKAKVEITGTMIPFKVADTMNIDYQLEDLDMTSVNEVLLNYIPVDITNGMLSVYGELDRNQQKDRGYTKIFLEDFDFIKTDQEFKNPQHFIIEFFGAFVNIILKNTLTENVAVRVPFEKKNGQVDYDKSAAFWSSIKNLFDSLERGVENKY